MLCASSGAARINGTRIREERRLAGPTGLVLEVRSTRAFVAPRSWREWIRLAIASTGRGLHSSASAPELRATILNQRTAAQPRRDFHRSEFHHQQQWANRVEVFQIAEQLCGRPATRGSASSSALMSTAVALVPCLRRDSHAASRAVPTRSLSKESNTSHAHGFAITPSRLPRRVGSCSGWVRNRVSLFTQCPA